MADEEAQDERTEAATARRIGQAADDGRVALSRDLALWAGLVAGVMTLTAVAGTLRDSLLRMVSVSAGTLGDPNFFRLTPYFQDTGKWVLLVCAVAAAAGAAVFGFQTGGRFWPSLLLRGVESMFTGAGFKRLFSRRMAADLLISVVKVMAVGWAAWSALHDEFLTLPGLIHARPDAQFALLFRPLLRGSAKVLAAMGVLAGLDFALTRYRHRQSLKMTKEELRREHKEEEGDPLIRMHRRRRYRDLMKGRATIEVPRADVVVVNPTHIAIALRYRPGKDRAPVVTAKGKGDLAEFMRGLARSNGIPIVEDVPLARLLYRKVKVGRAVPAETYKAVAAILAFVYRITRGGAAMAADAPPGPSMRAVRPDEALP